MRNAVCRSMIIFVGTLKPMPRYFSQEVIENHVNHLVCDILDMSKNASINCSFVHVVHVVVINEMLL